jgi:hypothetical protein
MPRRTRAELEVENAELREYLETIRDDLSGLFDSDNDEDDTDDEDEDEDN